MLTDDARFRLMLRRPVEVCAPCLMAKAKLPELTVVSGKPTVTTVPEGFKIKTYAPRWAAGSRRPMKGGRGDAPSVNSPSTLVRGAYDKRAVTAYAATSTINRKG